MQDGRALPGLFCAWSLSSPLREFPWLSPWSGWAAERLSGWPKLAPNLKERHNLNMADEPENMTLILLREIRGEQERLAAQLARVLGELAEMREQTQLIPQIAGDVSELEREVSDLQITLAATRADIGAHQGNGWEGSQNEEIRLALFERQHSQVALSDAQ
jgi:hypothetical protein